jgi:hypothetical protein
MKSDGVFAMIARARQYLHARRSPDGLWHEFNTLAGEAVDWPSGYILDVLCRAGTDLDLLAECAILLISRQHSDGGWGYHSDVPTDADSTAAVLLFLNRLKLFPEIAHRAAQCLLRFQAEIGGFGTYQNDIDIRRYLRVGPRVDFRGWCKPSCEVTTRAGRALLSAGPQYKQAASKAWKFVKSRQIPVGRWEPYWWTTEFVTTSEAAALASALGERDALAGLAHRVAEQMHYYQTTSTEPTTFVSSLCLQILLLARRNSCDHACPIEYCTGVIAAQQGPAGGWRGTATLKIPPPHITSPGEYQPWQVSGPGTGVTTRDQHGLFTTATALSALVSLRQAQEQRP